MSSTSSHKVSKRLGVRVGLYAGLGLAVVTTLLFINSTLDILGLVHFIPEDTLGLILMIILGTIWLGVPLLASFLAARKTGDARQGAIAGRTASILGALISYITLMIFDSQIMPNISGSPAEDTLGWMLVLLFLAGVIAIIVGSFIGWVGGEIGWTVAEYSRFRID